MAGETQGQQPAEAGNDAAQVQAQQIQPPGNDMAGHAVGWQPQIATCHEIPALLHKPGAQPCPRQPMSDPSSFAPIVLALAGGLLILCGWLTTAGRGPGALIKPHRQGRRSAAKAQRRRYMVGGPMIVVGVLCVARIIV
jgi:hypothetical protein